MEEKEQFIKNKEIVPPKTKTIYDAHYGEIFWKNFLAGLGNGLGGLSVYLISLAVIGIIFFYFVLPTLMPTINAYTNFFKSVSSVINTKPSAPNSSENFFLQKLLGK